MPPISAYHSRNPRGNPATDSTVMGRRMRRSPGAAPLPPTAAAMQESGGAPMPSPIPFSQIAASMQGRPAPRMASAGQPAGGGASGAPQLPSSYMAALQDAIAGGPGTPQLNPGMTPEQAIPNFFNAANQANDLRYRQSLGLVAGQGVSSKDDARREYQSGVASDQQDLISRGLFNTTVMNAMQRRRGEDLSRANQRIDESVADRAAGIVERRTDQAPDLNQFFGLMQQRAQAAAQDQAQSRRTSSTIFGPRGPSTFGQPTGLEGAAGGGGGGGAPGGGGGGGSSAQGVQTFRNPNPRDFFGRTTKPGQRRAQAPIFMTPAQRQRMQIRPAGG